MIAKDALTQGFYNRIHLGGGLDRGGGGEKKKGGGPPFQSTPKTRVLGVFKKHK